MNPGYLRLGVIALLTLLLTSVRVSLAAPEQFIPLEEGWRFKLDPDDEGVRDSWFALSHQHTGWRELRVPHTWQVEPGTEGYYGLGWYAVEIGPLETVEESQLWLEFGSIYRDATVWLNGIEIGVHNGSGWTPFRLHLNECWRHQKKNLLVIRVDNRFSEDALPYLDSSDWAADGGIIRPVGLRILPQAFISQVLIDSDLSPDFDRADIQARVMVEKKGACGEELMVRCFVFPEGGNIKTHLNLVETEGTHFEMRGLVDRPNLWHFDFPRLYRLKAQLFCDGKVMHEKEVVFGIRQVAVHDGFFHLNGEPMRLMGVEWMPGSDPRYGMAEPPSIMSRVLRDLKELNTVLTRFHWQQDPYIFEFCDREGILVQEELPAWGPKTMERDLAKIQSSQMEEMISAHYNHPSIYAWGLCNEIGGQSPKAHKFVADGLEIARRLNPARLLTWASNSLQSNPDKDASRLVDFIEWNDYWESWYGGSLKDLEKNLELIAHAFPDKSLVISEYGLCECNPKNPVGDERRTEILKTHTELYRRAPNVAGAIFFDYNDYRTHIGDKGQDAFKQRVHGVVDLLGRRKPSWQALHGEASPIRTLQVMQPQTEGMMTRTAVRISTRRLEDDMPAYTLKNYLLIWTALNDLGHPIRTGKIMLPNLVPGSQHEIALSWVSFSTLNSIRVEVFRPTGYSVHDAEWRR